MFNMGFQGQFGGGFIQGPQDTMVGGAGVTYSQGTLKSKPKDRSGRKGPYGGTYYPYPSGKTNHRGQY